MGRVIDIKTDSINHIATVMSNACGDLDEAIAILATVQSSLNMKISSRNGIDSQLQTERNTMSVQKNRINAMRSMAISAASEYAETDNALGSRALGISEGITQPVPVDISKITGGFFWNSVQRVSKMLALFKMMIMMEKFRNILNTIQPPVIIPPTWVPPSMREEDTSDIPVGDNYDYNAELAGIKDWVKHPQPDGSGCSWNYDGVSVDCNWFSKYKLYKRGLFGDSLNDTYMHAGKEVQSEQSYTDWVNSNGNRGFAQTTVDYLKEIMDKNNGAPLYNIFLRDNNKNSPHSVLIDKVYYDNGVLKFVLSENHAADMVTRDNGAVVYNVTDQMTLTYEEFISKYGGRDGAPDALKIFGPSKTN